MFVVGISLYASRIILHVLGVSDYGTYKAVGGIVGVLSFVNVALGTGTSRFLTIALGQADVEKQNETFSTVFIAHLGLAFFISISADIVGLWFLHNHMVIEIDRMYAAQWVLHISVFTAFFKLTQVPYNASIIAHEDMSVFAYVTIIREVLILAILFCISRSVFDKLILYTVLIAILELGVLSYYRIYCKRHYQETCSKYCFNKKLFKNVLSFSSWNFLTNIANVFNTHGTLILLNLFFSPAIVASKALANQVQSAAMLFVSSFRLSVAPQITKKYAVQNFEGSQQLLLESMKYSYYLTLLITFPLCMMISLVLKMWLGKVPAYLDSFVILALVQVIFQVFNDSFYSALHANGKLKLNSILYFIINILPFPIAYMFYKVNYSPVTIAWLTLISYAIQAIIIKPIVVVKIAGYNWKSILSVYCTCLKVTFASLPLPIVLWLFVYSDSLSLNNIVLQSCIVLISSMSVLTFSWILGVDKRRKGFILAWIKQKWQ